MNKCVEYLAFVDAKTGKIKERFELEFEDKTPIEGRRPQLIKKLVGRALDEKDLKAYCLVSFLKNSKNPLTGQRRLTVVDLLKYAFSDEK